MHYLDQASTSFPKPVEVVGAITEYLTEFGVSPGRGNYRLAELADRRVEKTREKLAKVLQVSQPDHIAFTQNATYAINAVLKGFLNLHDHVLLCEYTHNAALRPLERLRKEKNVSYDLLPVDLEGNIDFEAFYRLKRPNTRLVILTEASNVIGVKVDVTRLLQECRASNIATLVDVTQSLGYIRSKETPDFLVGTGHKTLLGPSGVGFFYAQDPERIAPFIEGGSPGNSSLSLYHPEQAPYRFEGGTLNSVGISGLYGSLSYIEKKGIENMAREAMSLFFPLWKFLTKQEGVKVYGTQDFSKKIPLVSFNLQGWMPQEVAQELHERFHIAVRAGLHCAPLMHKKLKTAPLGTVRVSISHLNLKSSIEILQEAIIELVT